ncbi:hypothetical protein LRX75_23190 [Rhizobium sp. DKSPLA3]|uniref:Uncharacterized protein n=1 Tax=Rhizobium quercicola TaxID=2901226 RepID=A0A9X1T2T9_9HYPH|nr:hypothetical protein [Rhizobium quercicola]MCD7111927.1 hypothetical protein [Rhizobium quercicola]
MTYKDPKQRNMSSQEAIAETKIALATEMDPAGSETPISERAGKFLKHALSVSWARAKRTAIYLNEQRKVAIAQREKKLAEKKRNFQVQAFRTAFSKLESHKAQINPASWKKIEEYEAAVESDPVALYAFAESNLIKNLLKHSESRSAFLQVDRQRMLPTYCFETDADDLFSAIGYDHIIPTLKAIASKYKVSNAGNVMAGAILAGRKNMGGAAMAMADSARVGAHNGAADTAFTNHLRHIVFARSAAGMSDTQRRYVRYAYRIGYLGLGESSVINRSIFSLIYSNNNCTVKPPTPHNKFSGNLHAEFHNNFSHLIWTVQQAAAHLDEIRAQGGLRESLFSQDEIRGLLSWTDNVPSPGFHLQRTT